LREDVSSALGDVHRRPNPALNRDVSGTSASLDQFVDAIVDADDVVTDRLHVAVTAVLAGVPLRFVNPRDEKISRYIDFAFGGAFDHAVERVDVAWLEDNELIVPAPERQS
ncbi:MAG: polysaccharide pyruvyl transferase family protein, partial [Actinomycetes bacterium]